MPAYHKEPSGIAGLVLDTVRLPSVIDLPVSNKLLQAADRTRRQQVLACGDELSRVASPEKTRPVVWYRKDRRELP